MHSVTLGSTAINHGTRLETIAIYSAIHMLYTERPDNLSTRPIQIFTDSQGALLELTSLKNGYRPHNWDWAKALNITTKILNQHDISIIKIKGHSGILGNELADHWAKFASNNNSPVHPLQHSIPNLFRTQVVYKLP